MPTTHYGKIVAPTDTGAHESYYAEVGAVLKGNQEYGYCVANEYISASIGFFLGLGVPPPVLVRTPSRDDQNLWFASLRLNQHGETLPPVIPERCVERAPRESTGLIVFDELIHNVDRHDANLAFDDEGIGSVLKIFDHGHALLGDRSEQGIEHLQNHATAPIDRHCFHAVLETDQYFSYWIRRVQQLPDFFIDDACQHVVGHGIDQQEAEATASFIKHRRDEIKRLVLVDTSRYSAIDQRSLGL